MNVLLSYSTSYWNKWKNVISYPLILSSSSLVMVNNFYERDSENYLKTINIVLNAFNVFLMGLLNNFKITEKVENFKSKSAEYIDLAHSIENDLYKETTTYEKINIYQEKFDMLSKNVLLDAIPSYIKNKVKNKYPDYHLPLIIGEISPPSSETNEA